MSKKRILLLAANALCILCVLGGLIGMSALGNSLLSQKAAARWRGEGDGRFAQVSVLAPESSPLSLEGIRSFREKLDPKITGAGIETPETGRLWVDAWCADAEATASAPRGSSRTQALAVGGDFFLFHPLELLDGQYIAGDDLMQDRVLVNEALAWRLYGGQKVAGMAVNIDGRDCIIAGVVRLEDNFAVRRALDEAEPLLFAPYALLSNEEESLPITVYEIVMPNPLTDFARQFVQESLGDGANGETLENSLRFSGKSIRGVLKNYFERLMRKNPIVYPYWENAARYVEAVMAILWLVTVLFCLLPGITCAVYLVKLYLYGKRRAKQGLRRFRDNLELRRERRWQQEEAQKRFGGSGISLLGEEMPPAPVPVDAPEPPESPQTEPVLSDLDPEVERVIREILKEKEVRETKNP